MVRRSSDAHAKRGPVFRISEAALEMRPEESLTLAVVADTHSRPHGRALPLIRGLGVDAIVHAGDIGDRSVLATLSEIAPLVVVRGNIDERATDLPDAVILDLRSGGATRMKILVTHIAVTGPRIRADAARLAREHHANLILCGHSHVPFMTSDRGLTVFNPGSIGPRRFHLPIVFGVLTIQRGRLSLQHVDCETGAEWTPSVGPSATLDSH